MVVYFKDCTHIWRILYMSSQFNYFWWLQSGPFPICNVMCGLLSTRGQCKLSVYANSVPEASPQLQCVCICVLFYHLLKGLQSQPTAHLTPSLEMLDTNKWNRWENKQTTAKTTNFEFKNITKLLLNHKKTWLAPLLFIIFWPRQADLRWP